MIEDLKARYTPRLIEERDFTVFEEMARDVIDGGPGTADGAAALEALLRFTVDSLAPDDKEAAARAVDCYVEKVWPIRAEHGLGAGQAGQIASAAAVRSLLAGRTSHILQQAGQNEDPAAPIALGPPTGAEEGPADREAGGDGGNADEEALRADTSGQANGGPNDDDDGPGDFAAGAGVDFPALCELLTRKSEGGLRRIMLVGMATSGKTFFLGRLKATMRGGYFLAVKGGFANTDTPDVGRTKRMTRYLLYPPTKRKMAFEIFDMPGDRFREVNSNAVKVMDAEYRKSIYALLATVDLFVFVEPALQTLAPALYREEGDDIEREALAQRLEEIRSDTNLAPAERQHQEDEAVAASRSERRVRIAIHNSFLDAIGVLAKRIEVIRRIKVGGTRSAAEALQKRIEIFERDYPFDKLAVPLDRTVSVPALLLLSRADEYKRRVPDERDSFDRDPALTMLEKAPDRFKKFTSLFDAFAVDFITSSEMETPAPQLLEDTPHAGFDRLLEDWAMPAMRDCRQPGWRKWLWGRRWLRHPQTALRLRSYFDPKFGKLYGTHLR